MTSSHLPKRDIEHERMLGMEFQLSPAQASVLSCILRTNYANNKELQKYSGFKHVRVFVSQCRARIKIIGCDINWSALTGYWMEPEQKELINEILTTKYGE